MAGLHCISASAHGGPRDQPTCLGSICIAFLLLSSPNYTTHTMNDTMKVVTATEVYAEIPPWVLTDSTMEDVTQ